MSIDFTQIISYVWDVLGLVWLIGLVSTKRTVRAQPTSVRLFQVALLALCVFLMASPHVRTGWLGERFLPATQTLGIAGLALTVAGCLFAIWARILLGSNWSGRATIKDGHELIVSGPYAVARHPIYSGLLLAALGTAVVIGEFHCILAYVLLVIGLAVKIGQEERLMQRAFPEAYPAYRQRVKALIPGVL